MARVYLAIQESFEREVALKVMSAAFSDDTTFTERFVREAKIVSQLVHPNIVTVYDVGLCNNHHFLSMQYVPGDHLKSKLKSLTTEQRLQVVKDIARALDYASQKGYVHRDVKPENIMLHEEDGRAVLMDFGIACIADTTSGMTQTGMAIGTPHYMSPEQAKGKPVDSRTDLYSLGVVLYLLLANRLPYDADSAIAVGIKHVSEPIPQLPDHLKLFQPVIDKAMAKHPDKRFQTGAEFIAALETISAEDLAMMEQLRQKSAGAQPVSDTDPTRLSGQVRQAVSRPQTRAVPPQNKPVAKPSANTNSDRTTEQVVQRDAQQQKNAERAARSAQHKAAMKSRALQRTGQNKQVDIDLELAETISVDNEDRRELPQEKPPSRWPWWAAAAVLFGIVFSAPLYRDILPVGLQNTVDAGVAEMGSLKQQTLALFGGSDAVDITQASAQPATPTPVETAVTGEGPELTQDKKEQARALRERLVDDISLAAEIAGLYRGELAINPQDQQAQWALNELLEYHLQEVRSALQKRDLEKADMYFASMGSVFPDVATDERYQKVTSRRAQIENANSAIHQAEMRFAAGQLLTPENDNALMFFESALVHDENNPAAIQGMQRIATALREKAEIEMGAGRFIKALELTNQGLEVNRTDAELIQLQQTLSTRLERQRSVVNTLAQAQQLMTSRQYQEAYRSYQDVLKLDAKNRDARRGLGDIEQQFVLDTERAINTNAFDEARATINRGYELFPQSQRWLSLEAALDQAVEADFVSKQPVIPAVRVSNNQVASLPDAQNDLVNVDRTIHIGFRYDNFSADTSVVQAILFDGGRSVQIAQVPVVVNGNDGIKFFKIDRPVEGFSEGGYNIDLMLGQDRLGSVSFNVKRAGATVTTN